MTDRSRVDVDQDQAGRRYGPGGGVARIGVELPEPGVQRQDDVFLGDVRLFDLDGNLVVEATGLRMALVDNGSGATSTAEPLAALPRASSARTRPSAAHVPTSSH